MVIEGMGTVNKEIWIQCQGIIDIVRIPLTCVNTDDLSLPLHLLHPGHKIGYVPDTGNTKTCSCGLSSLPAEDDRRQGTSPGCILERSDAVTTSFTEVAEAMRA
jgi:hypothetical protein